jgi:CubicO group peptidase (beta-lactamase class C family)
MFRVWLKRAPSVAACTTFLLLGILLVMLSILNYERALASGTMEVKDRFSDVRANILETMERTGVASVAIAVAEDGKIVWEEGFGWANRVKETKATVHTIYHLASISKPFTATGLMLLVERGLVDLDKPANDYLGESKLSALIGSADGATVRRILFHTSGLPMYWNFFKADGTDKRPSMPESIRRYGFLVTAPGESYNYSNFGYGILGYIISRVSGKDYADFMREEVFEPLALANTSVQVDMGSRNDEAQMYDENRGAIAPYDFDHRGASAVLSTAHDLVRFGMFHLDDHLPDQKPILKNETMKRMQTEAGSSFHDEGGVVVDYLLGSFGGVNYGGYRLIIASGSMPGAASRLVIVPSENVAVAILSNGDNIDLWPIQKTILEITLPGFADGAASGEKTAPEEASPGEETVSDEERTNDEETILDEETAHDEETIPDETAMDHIPPESFIGSWSGKMLTYAENIDVEMVFSKDDAVSMKIGGRSLPPIGIKTPLGEMGFKKGVFKGLFMGRIDTPDAARYPHVVLVECRIRENRLVGTASAVAMNEYFCLPYRLQLYRAK